MPYLKQVQDKDKHKTTTTSAYLEGSGVALKGRHRRKTTTKGKHKPKIKVALKTSRKNTMWANQPYILTGLRHLLAIVSSQISTMMEPSKCSGHTLDIAA